MKHLAHILIIIFISFSHFSYSQLLRDHEVDESTIKPWVESDIEKYEDRYIFQPNDGNYLIIIVDDTCISAQIHYPHHWTEAGFYMETSNIDSSEFRTHSEYVPLTGVEIKNGKFYSDQYIGEFITFQSDSILYKGIKVLNSWNLDLWPEYKYEIGVKRSEKPSEFLKGKYTETSTTILDSTYLSSFSKKELQIMRNEIYARYQYRFKEGSEMSKYFSQQTWYVNRAARYKYVSHMFTWIELKNIELIKKIEELK